MDMCLIMLAGWFSPSPTKNNFSIQSLFQIPTPPWLGSKSAANWPQDHDLHPNLMKLGQLCPSNLAKVGHRVGGQVELGPKVGLVKQPNTITFSEWLGANPDTKCKHNLVPYAKYIAQKQVLFGVVFYWNEQEIEMHCRDHGLHRVCRHRR